MTNLQIWLKSYRYFSQITIFGTLKIQVLIRNKTVHVIVEKKILTLAFLTKGDNCFYITTNSKLYDKN